MGKDKIDKADLKSTGDPKRICLAGRHTLDELISTIIEGLSMLDHPEDQVFTDGWLYLTLESRQPPMAHDKIETIVVDHTYKSAADQFEP